MGRISWFAVFVVGMAAAGCEYYSGLCREVTCSGHGTCKVIDGTTTCACDPGYIPDGIHCLPQPSCDWVTCSGHGTCVMASGQAVCECDPGFVSEGLNCVFWNGCLEVGLDCVESAECCSGICLVYDGYDVGYCTLEACESDSDCIDHANDGMDMCCVDLGGERSICMKNVEGSTCPAGPFCGGPCNGMACDACIMTATGEPVCTHACATDADCSGCFEPAAPETHFTCQPGPDAATHCLPEVEVLCESSHDCEAEEVCIPWTDADGTGLEGQCNKLGELPVGATCDESDDPNDLPPAERCAGFYCLWDHCSAVCSQDADCPENMECEQTAFCMDAACDTVASIGMCRWTYPSYGRCGSNADCPPGRVCDYYISYLETVELLCIDQLCATPTAGCAEVGQACGPDLELCVTGLCLGPDADGIGFCSALCEIDADCPPALACQPFDVGPASDGTPILVSMCQPPE